MTKKRKISYADLGGAAPTQPAKPEGAGSAGAVAGNPLPVAGKAAEAKPEVSPAPKAEAKPKRVARPRAPKKVAAEAPQPVAPPVKAPDVVPGIAMRPRVSSPVEIAAVLRTSDPKGFPAYTVPEGPGNGGLETGNPSPAGIGQPATGDPSLAGHQSAPDADLRRIAREGSIDDYASALFARLAAMAPAELEEDQEGERDTRPLRERLRTREGVADLLMFRIGPEIFATELAMVEEAVSLPGIHHLPEMPAAMLGAFNLRGRLTPVYSPAHVIGVPLAGTAQAALLVRANGRRLGLAVDDVEDVFQVDLATVREAPGIDDADGILLGVAHHGQDLVAVLDAEALVAACLTGHVMETA
jgi:purine-binding chemotaxis protein CheW